MPSLDSLNFNTLGLRSQDENENARSWLTDEGDNLTLYFYEEVPDIEADTGEITQIRSFYRNFAELNNAAILQVDSMEKSGLHFLYQIMKTPQEEGGTAYVGTITFPFRDYSYVIRVQCLEKSEIGFREAEILAEKVRDGTVSVNEQSQSLKGWSADPYNKTVVTRQMANISENSEYDVRFPDHPLSRLRRQLRHILSSVILDQELLQAPAYKYEPPLHQAR